MPLSATPFRSRPRGLISGRGLGAGRKPPARTLGWRNRPSPSGPRSGPASRKRLPAEALAAPLPPVPSEERRNGKFASRQKPSGVGAESERSNASLPDQRTSAVLPLPQDFGPPELLLAGQGRHMLFPDGTGIHPPRGLLRPISAKVSKQPRKILRSTLNRGLHSPPEPLLSRFAKAGSAKACPSASAHAGCNTLNRERR